MPGPFSSTTGARGRTGLQPVFQCPRHQTIPSCWGLHMLFPTGFRVFFYSSLSLINVYNGTTLTICECKTFGMHLRRQGLTRGVNLTAEDSEPRTLEESIHFISFIRQQTWAGPGSELLQVSKGRCVLGPAASPGRLFRWLGEQRPCLELIKQGYHLYP